MRGGSLIASGSSFNDHADLDSFGCHRTVTPACEGTRPGDELFKGERLAEVIIRPSGQSFHPFRHIAQRRQHQHRRLYLEFPQFLDDMDAVEERQHAVEDDDVICATHGGF